MRKVEKSFIIISIALISLLCIGAVSAADDIAADDVAAADSEDIGSIDDYINEDDDSSLGISDVAEDNPPTEVLKEDSTESNDVLGEDAPKTFTQLKDEIANPVDGVVTLSGTYKYDETADAALTNQGIVIRNNITIKGPATLDGNNLSRIFYLYQSSATLNGLTFINAKGQQYGGAILAYGLSPTIENCIFKNNLVIDDEDQYYAYGGAIYFWSTTGATVNNCTFEDNLADFESYGAGGAIYDYGDGLTIKDSTFTHNQAASGGALESYGTNMNIDGCLFDSNQAIYGQSGPYANGDAGAVMLNYVQDDSYEPVESNHKLTRSIFINNQAGNAASTLRNDAIGTNISDCIFLGPKTLMGNSILQGCDSGTECENIWLGHTTENQSTYVSGGPDNWLVLDLNAVAKEGYYNVIASLNHLYTRSTGEVTDVESGISDILFNVTATAGTCPDTVKIQNGEGTIKYKLYEPEEGTLSVGYYGITKSIDLQGLVKQPEDVILTINVDDITVGQIAKVEGQLTDLDGVGIVGIALTVVVNGVEQVVNTIEDGKFSLEVADLAVGQYSANVTLASSEDYNGASNSTIFNVKADDVNPPVIKKISTVITAGHTSIYTYNKAIDSKTNSYFTVTLKDVNGKVLAKKAFKFIVNGKVYNYVTDAKGQKKIYILSKAKKTISAKILFAGDDQYAQSSKAVKIKVNPQKVKIVAKKQTFKATKKVKKFKATLKNTKGKAIKGKKLVFVVNKKKYTAKTNKKGVATVKVKLTAKKTYKVTVKFAGDQTYKKATKKAKIKIK